VKQRHREAPTRVTACEGPSEGPCYPVGVSAPVQNHDQAVERLARCESQIRALGVTRLALFGSVVRGEPRADSDVDILVQFGPGAKSYGRFLALSDLLEVHLGRRVELVTTEALSPFIGPRILAEAQDVLRAA
jgi:predicted nucleotidyltransferase